MQTNMISFWGTFVLLFSMLTMISGVQRVLFPEELEWRLLDHCLDEDKMPAKMPKPNPRRKTKCYSLLEQGPCKEGEWLVLDKTSKEPKVKCEKKLCENLENTVPTSSGECRSINDLSDCPMAMATDHVELQINPYGVGKSHF